MPGEHPIRLGFLTKEKPGCTFPNVLHAWDSCPDSLGAGKAIFTIISAVARLERDIIAERVEKKLEV